MLAVLEPGALVACPSFCSGRNFGAGAAALGSLQGPLKLVCTLFVACSWPNPGQQKSELRLKSCMTLQTSGAEATTLAAQGASCKLQALAWRASASDTNSCRAAEAHLQAAWARKR